MIGQILLAAYLATGIWFVIWLSVRNGRPGNWWKIPALIFAWPVVSFFIWKSGK